MKFSRSCPLKTRENVVSDVVGTKMKSVVEREGKTYMEVKTQKQDAIDE